MLDERLTALGATVFSLVSDRAKALIQLAETGFACLSMPDVFHCLHDLGKSYSLALAQKLRQAQQALTHAEARCRWHTGKEVIALEGSCDTLKPHTRLCSAA